jgi:invasion protein IalB
MCGKIMIKRRVARNLLAAGVLALVAAPATAEAAGEAQGPTSLSETYDAWTVRCANQQQGDKTRRVCQMSQELMQQQTRQRVLTFAVAQAENGARATLIMPFGLLLSDGFRIQIADEVLLRGAYRTCLPAGCVAEVELPADAIAKLEGAENVNVVMTAESGQQVKTDVSLKGFAAAYKRLSGLVAAGQ